MKDKKSFLAKYATRPAALEKGSKSNSLTDDTPQDPSAFMVYPFKKAIEAINLIVDFITAPEATMSRPDYLQIKLDEICQQKGEQCSHFCRKCKLALFNLTKKRLAFSVFIG